jgi:hypothetical protein
VPHETRRTDTALFHKFALEKIRNYKAKKKRSGFGSGRKATALTPFEITHCGDD